MGANSDSDQPDAAELNQRIRELERRVRALEERAGGNPAPRSFEVAPAETRPPVAPPRGDSAKAIPVVGKALLGIAGAYLLRALTEFKAVPLVPGVVAGMVYALGWLLFASKVAAGKPFVGAVRAVTSALILAPLLWEATLRFHAFSAWTAAGVLVVFSSFGFAVSWRSNLTVVAWITTLASLLTALALLLATHDVAPFTLAVLAMAAIVECSACFDHWLGQRWIVALVSDFAVLLLTGIASRAGALPDGYLPIPDAMSLAALIALPAIYLSSTSVRALWCGATLTAFETIQIGMALLLSMTGVLRAAGRSSAAIEAVAAFGLACGVVFYTFSFGAGGRTGSHGRNFHIYSTLGLLLVFIGSRIEFSGAALALVLSTPALLGLAIDRWRNEATLRWHAAAYLLLAAALSGLAAWAAARLLGTRYGWLPLPAAAWIGAAATLLGYALTWRSTSAWGASPAQTVPVLAIAASAAFSLAGLAAAALTALCGSAVPADFCSTLRTLVLTALAMLLALGGTVWKRRELVWLVYPFLALTAYKLLVQDLPGGRTLALFASLFLYGGALVLLPRIFQKSRRE